MSSKEYTDKYNASPAGRSARAKYAKSPKGKIATAKAQARFDASPKGKAKRSRYAKSPVGRATRALWQATPEAKLARDRRNALPQNKASRLRYAATPEGGAAQARYDASPKGRASGARNRARRVSCLENCVNTLTSEEWAEIQEEQHGQCKNCDTFCKLTMDHVIPLSRGGGHVKENIQGLCRSCNSSKGNRIALELWK